MPIEIRELVIRAQVSAEPEDPLGRRDTSSTMAAVQSPGTAEIDVEALVQDCVRQVLRVLASRERER